MSKDLNKNNEPSINPLSIPGTYSFDFLYNQTKRIMGIMVGYKELRMMYACAIKEIKTKLEILNTEFELRYRRNPISYIQTRLKSTKSILAKLQRVQSTPDLESITNNINDVAGIRVICPYIDDIFRIADALLSQDDVTLIEKKDYVSNPKPNGYRSLHLIIKIPVFFAERRIDMKAEVQIRTIAMDFWASLEHQLHYKNNTDTTESLTDELCQCAEAINEIDRRMQSIRLNIDGMEDNMDEDDVLIEQLGKFDTPIYY